MGSRLDFLPVVREPVDSWPRLPHWAAAPAPTQNSGSLPPAPDAAWVQRSDLPTEVREAPLTPLPSPRWTGRQRVLIGEHWYRRAASPGGGGGIIARVHPSAGVGAIRA